MGAVRAYRSPIVKFSPRTLPPGYYEYSITLAAATNPTRTTTLTSKPFSGRLTGWRRPAASGHGHGVEVVAGPVEVDATQT